MDIPLEVSDVMVFRVSPRDVSIVDIEQMSLVNCVIEVRRRPENDGSNGPLPRIVNRYRDLLLDSDVTDTILETALRTTREGWMLKAKICYQMTKQLSHPQVFEHITGCGVEVRFQFPLNYKNLFIFRINKLFHTGQLDSRMHTNYMFLLQSNSLKPLLLVDLFDSSVGFIIFCKTAVPFYALHLAVHRRSCRR